MSWVMSSAEEGTVTLRPSAIVAETPMSFSVSEIAVPRAFPCRSAGGNTLLLPTSLSFFVQKYSVDGLFFMEIE